MPDSFYVPGRGWAVVSSNAALLADGDLPAERLLAFWEAACAGRGLDELLELLTGGRLVGLPQFVVAVRDGDQIRVLARPGVRAAVGDASGPRRTVAQGGANLWVEDVVDLPDVLWLGATDQLSPRLPLASGAAAAATLAWSPGQGNAAGVPEVAAPVAEVAAPVAEVAVPVVEPAEPGRAEPDPAEPDPAEPDPAEPEPAEPDLAEPEVAESAEPEPAEREVAEPELAGLELAEPALPEASEPARAEPAPPEPEEGLSLAPVDESVPAHVLMGQAGTSDLSGRPAQADSTMTWSLPPDAGDGHPRSPEWTGTLPGTSFVAEARAQNESPDGEPPPGSGPVGGQDGAGPAREHEAQAASPASPIEHLWARAVKRTVEEAALREEEAVDAAEGRPSASGPPEMVLPEMVLPEMVLPPQAAADNGSGGAWQPPPLLGGTSLPPLPAPAWAASSTHDLDRTPPPAASTPVRPAAGAPGWSRDEPDDESDDESDHDGLTIRASELRELQEADDSRVLVLAVSCPRGHLNPPEQARCRVCSEPVEPQEPEERVRPVLGMLRFADGQEFPLDRSLLIGRAPSVGRVSGSDMPRPIRVPNSAQDVSRNHLEIRLDRWHVLAVDLGSSNGTIVTVPNGVPQRLVAQQPFPVGPGTEIVLSDDVRCVFEVSG